MISMPDPSQESEVLPRPPATPTAPSLDEGLRELEQRLSDRVLTLSELADASGSERLLGKAQGVDLALSYVQEALREIARAS